MKTKYTQGKWEVVVFHMIDNSDHFMIRSNGCCICTISNNKLEDKANVKLIATAPELWGGLRGAYHTINHLLDMIDLSKASKKEVKRQQKIRLKALNKAIE